MYMFVKTSVKTFFVDILQVTWVILEIKKRKLAQGLEVYAILFPSSSSKYKWSSLSTINIYHDNPKL